MNKEGNMSTAKHTTSTNMTTDKRTTTTTTTTPWKMEELQQQNKKTTTLTLTTLTTAMLDNENPQTHSDTKSRNNLNNHKNLSNYKDLATYKNKTAMRTHNNNNNNNNKHKDNHNKHGTTATTTKRCEARPKVVKNWWRPKSDQNGRSKIWSYHWTLGSGAPKLQNVAQKQPCSKKCCSGAAVVTHKQWQHRS